MTIVTIKYIKSNKNKGLEYGRNVGRNTKKGRNHCDLFALKFSKRYEVRIVVKIANRLGRNVGIGIVTKPKVMILHIFADF